MVYFVSAWVFVWLVTLFDAGFAWIHRHTFTEWELNPVANSLAVKYGIHSVLCFRVLTILAGFAVITLARKRLRDLATVLVAAVHLGLFLVYVVGFTG